MVLHLSSVTTILDATKRQEDKDALAAWRTWMGEEKASQIVKEAAALGTIIHNSLEKHMLGETIRFGSNGIHKMAKQMTETVIEKGLPKIQKVFGLEAALYFPGLYAGTADLIVSIDDFIMIGDFKNTIRMKKEDKLHDYKCQLVAYGMAHNEMFGTNIDRAKVMMIARPKDGVAEYKEFDMDPKMFKEYSKIWIDRVEQFYAA